jgi:hypothetical protein
MKRFGIKVEWADKSEESSIKKADVMSKSVTCGLKDDIL